MTATTKRRYRQYVTCWACRRPNQRHEGHGLCRACHIRWDAAGRPDTGPPPPMPNIESGRLGALHRIEGKADRLQEYAHLAGFGISDEEAAARLGLSLQTVAEYRRQLKREPLQLRICCDERKAS